MTLLQIKGVCKKFGGLNALNDVNLNVQAGSVHAIIGPNGAGKSTLLNCLVGRLVPDSGTVNFDGTNLIGLRPHAINQTGVVRVFQTPEIFGELSVLENVVIPTLAHRDGHFRFKAWSRTEEELDAIDIAEQALLDIGLADKRHQTANSLSRGDKRRLELAMGLAQSPRLLLLDEPTAGMSRADTNNTIDVLQRLSDRAITMVIIEHDMHVVFSLAQRISVLASGTVISEGLPADIKVDERVKTAYLGGTHT